MSNCNSTPETTEMQTCPACHGRQVRRQVWYVDDSAPPYILYVPCENCQADKPAISFAGCEDARLDIPHMTM